MENRELSSHSTKSSEIAAEAREEGMTCVDGHDSLVHEEAEPRGNLPDSAGKRQ